MTNLLADWIDRKEKLRFNTTTQERHFKTSPEMRLQGTVKKKVLKSYTMTTKTTEVSALIRTGQHQEKRLFTSSRKDDGKSIQPVHLCSGLQVLLVI